MSLSEKLTADLKVAMKAKDKPKLNLLRSVKSSFKNKEIETQQPLTAEEETAVLMKMIKQRKEAFKQYEEAGRSDLAEKEVAEIKILEDFLPEQLSEEELRALIETAVKETEAESMKDMGKVMNHLRPLIQGKADPSYASSLIKARLQGA